MTQSDLKPQILSVKEFRLEFNIPDSALSVGKYENGHYGWQAKLADGSILRGPVSQKLLSKGEDATAALVKYFWDEEGEPLNAPVWVLQIRPTQAQIEKTFALCQLLNLLNDKKKILFGGKWRRLYLSEFKAILVDCKKEGAYIDFSIPKKNGKLRHISSPIHELKIVQSCLNLILQEKYHPTAAAMGFVPGRSVADNARVHMGQNYVYNIDVKDFFPSISQGRVFAMLQQSPYSFDKATASIIADLCCYKGVLPQGAPTSPILTNIICERLDWRLSKLAKRYNLKYSRYADDISFCGMVNVFHKDGRFVEELQHYIQKEGFTINPEKTRLNTIGDRQEVTGLTVNEKPNVSKHYVKSLRTMIYNWEKLGREEAQKKMALIYQKAGKQSVKGIPQIENVIQGKLNYLKMIKGGSDTTYLKLNDRFQALMGQLSGLHEILKIWEKEGIEAASCEYYNRIPFEELFDRGVWTLSEFESITGKKVDFVPARKSRPDYSKEARKAMSMFNTQTNESDTGASDANSDDPKNILLANALQEMGFKEDLDAVIDNQPYWGKIQLTCDWKIDLQKDIFVTYGSNKKGRKRLYFSNTRGYFINGTVMTNEEIQKTIGNIRQNGSSDNFLESLLENKCVSHEDRALRSKLILDKLNGIGENDQKEEYEISGKVGKHNPRKMVSFLYQFSCNDKLKWFTHDPEGMNQFCYDTYIQSAQEEIKTISQGVNTETIINVKNFLFDTNYNAKDSFDREIKGRWKDLSEWCSTHPNEHPYNVLVKDKLFSRYIMDFKNTIEFRTDDPSMLFFIRIKDYLRKVALASPDIAITYTDSFYSIGECLRTFIDIRQLFKALALIGDWIKKYKSRSPNVELSLSENIDSYTLSIFHVGSYLDNIEEKLKGEDGDIHKLRNILLNVADLSWEVDQKITESGKPKYISKRIVYLDSESKYLQNKNGTKVNCPAKIEALSTLIGGVKYLIKFYKNKNT